jgi:hypothetical protein
MVLSPSSGGFTPEQIAESLPDASPAPSEPTGEEKTIKIDDISSILPQVAPGSATPGDMSTSNLDSEIKIAQDKLAEDTPTLNPSSELPPEQTGDIGIQLTDPDKPS